MGGLLTREVLLSFPSEGRGGERALNSRWAWAKGTLRMLYGEEGEGRRLGGRRKEKLKRGLRWRSHAEWEADRPRPSPAPV